VCLLCLFRPLCRSLKFACHDHSTCFLPDAPERLEYSTSQPNALVAELAVRSVLKGESGQVPRAGGRLLHQYEGARKPQLLPRDWTVVFKLRCPQREARLTLTNSIVNVRN